MDTDASYWVIKAYLGPGDDVDLIAFSMIYAPNKYEAIKSYVMKNGVDDILRYYAGDKNLCDPKWGPLLRRFIGECDDVGGKKFTIDHLYVIVEFLQTACSAELFLCDEFDFNGTY